MRRARSPLAEPRALLAPAWLWYAAFLLTPVAITVAYSLARSTGFFDVDFTVSLEQFRRIWDPIYLRVFRDTFLLAATGTVLTLLIAYPFAYAIATRVKRRSIALLAVVVPFWTSLLVRTYAWALILEPEGPLARALQRIGLGELDLLYTRNAVLIGLVYDYLPLAVFPLYVAIDRVDRRLLEASRDLGASRLETFRRVTLPLTRPGIVVAALLVFVPMCGEYIVPSILGGAKSYLLGSLIANETLEGIDYPFGAALGVTTLVLLLAFVLVAVRWLGKGTEDVLGDTL